MTTTVAPVRTPEQIEIDEVVLARVKEGIALLQRVHGADWVDHIDLAALHLNDSAFCVLGQVYGDYDDGLAELSLRQDDAVAFGFYADDDAEDDRWETLTDVWRHALAEVQA